MGIVPSFSLLRGRGEITFANPANPTADGSNASVFTFSAVSLGVNGSNRVVVLAIGYGGNGVAPTISSVTVDGITATSVIETAWSPGDTNRAAIFMATGVAATSGDVVVTLSGAIGTNRSLAVSVFNLLGAISVAPSGNNMESANAGSGTTPLDLTLDTLAGGALIGAGSSQGSSHTWTNVTEVSEQTVNNSDISAAGNATAAATASLAVDMTVSATSPQAAVAAAFTPA